MTTLRAAMVLTLVLAPVASADGDVHEQVARALERLQAGEHEQALAELTAASAARPDDPVITFDLGTAQLAAGQLEEAESTLALAATLVEPDLALAVARNRALVAARQAEALGGDRPEELQGKDRDRLVERALAAITHLRTVLEASRNDENARHDMGVLKTWLIALRDEWRRRDEERANQQQDQPEQPESSLQIIERLRDAQQTLGEAMASEDPEPDLQALATREREEVAPLVEEFRSAFARELEQARGQAGAAPGAPTRPGESAPDPLDEAEAAIGGATDTLAAGIERTAVALEGGEAEAARAASSGVVDLADELWKALAPFPAVLARAHEEQKAIVAAGDRALAADQLRTREHTLLMVDKARQMAEAGAAAASAPPTPSPAPDDGMAEALEKAQELGPQAAEHQETAASMMELAKWEGAGENTTEALRLLEEILASLPREQQQQQQDQEQQEQDDQQQQAEGEQDQQQDEQQQASESEQEASQEQAREQEGELSEEQVQALLRRIREREAERRKEERELRGSGRIPVEKDW